MNEETTVFTDEFPSKPSKKRESRDISWGAIAAIFAILICVRLFIAEPFLVYGSSMEPNFHTGDYLIIDELSYKLGTPKRGDVIVLVPPDQPSKHFIKRIVGLPGEKIVVASKKVTITNKEHPNGMLLNEPYVTLNSEREATHELSNDEYFVMGDNRAVSLDSRSWGPLPAKNITGKAMIRLYPFSQVGVIPGVQEQK